MKITQTNYIFEDFPIGQNVKIVAEGCDFYFFFKETGVVIRNSGEHLGIIVKFDKPRHFEGGYIQTEFNFRPTDLKPIKPKKKIK